MATCFKKRKKTNLRHATLTHFCLYTITPNRRRSLQNHTIVHTFLLMHLREIGRIGWPSVGRAFPFGRGWEAIAVVVGYDIVTVIQTYTHDILLSEGVHHHLVNLLRLQGIPTERLSHHVLLRRWVLLLLLNSTLLSTSHNTGHARREVIGRLLLLWLVGGDLGCGDMLRALELCWTSTTTTLFTPCH